MKIALINPPISGYNRRDLFESEPLGLAYLASYLEKEQLGVEILDCFSKGIEQIHIADGLIRRGLKDSDIIDSLLDINPDVIGIHSNFTMYFPDAKNVASLCRKVMPDTPIIFGGAHATMQASSIVETRVGDYVVRGEGELTIVELLRALKDGFSVNDILGITYRDSSDQVRVNPDRPLLKEIDSLPKPARHKLDMEKYLSHSREISPFSKNYPAASLITSRGCPYDCVFCSTKNMWKRKWRADSPEKVVAEIENLIAEYGVKEIIIQDDNFLTSKKRVIKILDLLIEKNLGVTLHNPAGLTVWTVDGDLLVKLRNAGFYRVLFPIETGSKKTLEFVKKPVDLDKVPQLVQNASRLGLWTQANFIIGFPYETRKDILETINYANNSGFDFAAFLIAQPFAGAEMYDIYRNEGLLQDESLKKRSIFFKTQFDTKYLKAGEIQELRDQAAKQYLKVRLSKLLNPVYSIKYFFPKINSISKLIYFFRIVLINYNFLFNKYRTDDIS